MLIKRVYEVDPLCCPKCQGEMKVITFIEPPQGVVIERILRHCGLWHDSRGPPGDAGSVHAPDGDGPAAASRELTLVAEDAIWAEAESLFDADVFARDPVDDWYRRPSDDEPRELTYVDEDTFWSEF